jgi:hypothetical protein
MAGQVVAGLGELALVRQEAPRPAEDALLLELEDLRIGVDAARDVPALLVDEASRR